MGTVEHWRIYELAARLKTAPQVEHFSLTVEHFSR
jgi:hypothetical protein